jgi:hypothetical protein
MLQTIYLAPEISKRLELLKRSDKKAALAAKKAEEIINRMQSGRTPKLAGSVTKHGEARIKGILKYDLGSGYRLVCFKQGNNCYLLYAGAHDDCHRWIENNREMDIEMVRSRCTALAVRDRQETKPKPTDSPVTTAVEEIGDPLEKITEQDLRKIFCGLVEGIR